MTGENVEKPDTKEKKPEAKQADAVARLKRGPSRPKRLRRGRPTAGEPVLVRGTKRCS